MADYVVNLTGTVEVDDSIVEELSTQTMIKMHEQQTIEAFVSHAQEVQGKQKGIVRYDTLSINEAPLNEREDVESKKMNDSLVVITPKEFGDVITKTSLASIQTGGRADLAAAQLVGINMGQSQTRHAMVKMDASSNILVAGGGGANTDVGAADILTGDDANTVYNRLARKNAVGLTAAAGEMVAVAHEDVLNDIRNEPGFVDVQKYANAETILKNEIGMYKGFRWVRNNLTTKLVGAGTGGLVDVYHTYFIAFNALGKDTSVEPHMRITGPFDKLARFVNVGWYGVYDYGIVEQDALWVAKSSASAAAE